ncbi:MAG: nuclear transport factor 2 family protein [Candidatus Bathyarchaeia archaeon]
MFCPNCGKEVQEGSYFCMYCGFKIASEEKASPEDVVRNVLIQRIDAIKNRDAKVLESLIDKERYTKFDDWPPFSLQGSEALENEARAFKVLKEYNYETKSWKIDICGDSAIATFIIKYRGKIRDLNFNIRSRVTVFLARHEEKWKIVHEHWSRFPSDDYSTSRNG